MKPLDPFARRSNATPASGGPGGRSGVAPIAPRVAVAAFIGLAVFGVLLLRLWALTVLGGADYAEAAERNQVRQLRVEAPRGVIYDRNGAALVTNRPARQLTLDLQDVPEDELPRMQRELARVTGEDPAEIAERIEAGALNPLTPVVIVDDLLEDEVAWYLLERATEFPGVDVKTTFRRNYLHGVAAAHVLGEVGEVSPEQLEGDFANLDPGDMVGRSGIEASYDEYLRGTDGYEAIEVDATGVRQGEGRGVPATPGRNLRLTIDLELQEAARRGLLEGISIARQTAKGARANAGAVVAMDPRTGEVLAMQSLPDYDPNLFVQGSDVPGRDREIERILTNPLSPQLNRAIAAQYPPGSVYKPVTGIAAMQMGYVTPDTLLPCPASMEISGTVFNNWFEENLADMDLARALEVSCDPYFYRLGVDFYNDPGTPLQDWSRTFGLGATSGIDVPGEQAGLVPDATWRAENFEGVDANWGSGRNVNLSIGQGDLLTTPVQMTRVFAALANRGTLHVPRLAKAVESPSGEVDIAIQSQEAPRIELPDAQWDEVHEGLVRSANAPDGTSAAIFSSFPVTVAGKTGTAEFLGKGNMAWYCAYAPAAKPTISACAIVEQGGGGSLAAAPVMRVLFEQHFGTKGDDFSVAAVAGSE